MYQEERRLIAKLRLDNDVGLAALAAWNVGK
jgi:hypothetical protein